MKKGDIIKVSYTGRFEDGLIETTDEKVAKKEGAYNEKRQYKPSVIAVDEGMVLPGLDKALLEMKKGEEKKVGLKAKEAFGERSFKLIKLVPIAEFKKQNVNPYPGMVLEIEGRPAKIQTVTSGRVRVDFNHPLAGKEVEYEIKVEDVATTEDQKIKFLIEKTFRTDKVKYTVSGAKDKKKISLEIPEDLKKDKYYVIMRQVFRVEADKFLGIKEVEYDDGLDKAKDKPKPAEKESKGKEAKEKAKE